jgi:hypothetical protein
MTSSPVGRPRAAGRRDLPDNLIPRPRNTGGRRVVYWYWRDPRDGREKPLQCPDDRETAIRRARELNSLVIRQRADQLVDEIAGSPQRRAAGTPFDSYALHCLTLWQGRGLADNTLRARKSLVNAARAALHQDLLHEIGVPEIAALLRRYTEAGKHRTAQAMRAMLADIWREAQQEGLLPADHPNPARIARRPEAKVRRARLTIESFHAILAAAESLAGTRGQWVRNALLLALVTGQRREDLAITQFRRGRDWEPAWMAYQLGDAHPIHPYPHVHDDALWVVQQKTGALVQIPLALQMEALGVSVGEAIERCRTRIATRHLLHHSIPFGNAPLGSPIHKDTISRGFAAARDAAGLEWPGKAPPTFHEIRSLAERLYRAQGVDTQALLGHRHARMTEVYADPRQASWKVVK